MSTTPPPDEPQPSEPAAPTAPAAQSWSWSSSVEGARMPMVGNAEFGLYFLALIVAWLVCWIDDGLDGSSWMNFFMVTTVAYLISRGIAKASRVLEH
jgi:hypothetical protein